jgi:hypothetical protein
MDNNLLNLSVIVSVLSNTNAERCQHIKQRFYISQRRMMQRRSGFGNNTGHSLASNVEFETSRNFISTVPTYTWKRGMSEKNAHLENQEEYVK